MREYLKQAFWAGANVPGLGRLPVNVLATLGFGILGVGHPAFWLLGAGLEAAYLAVLATHPRFQRIVDAQRRQSAQKDSESLRRELIERISGQARERLADLERKRDRVLEFARESHAEEISIESTREALERLIWTYLKLLVARHYLEASRVHASETDLKSRIAGLQKELAGAGNATASLRESQSATVRILQQRLQNLERCEQTLKEVDSDLDRVEAQVDLALESATVQGSGATLTANLELASQLLEDGLYFGEAESAVAALDEAYSAPIRIPQAVR